MGTAWMTQTVPQVMSACITIDACRQPARTTPTAAVRLSAGKATVKLAVITAVNVATKAMSAIAVNALTLTKRKKTNN